MPFGLHTATDLSLLSIYLDACHRASRPCSVDKNRSNFPRCSPDTYRLIEIENFKCKDEAHAYCKVPERLPPQRKLLPQ